MSAAHELVLEPRGPFDLAQSIAFLDGFTPAAAPQHAPGALRLAFTDDSGVPAGLSVTQDGARLRVRASSDLPAETLARHAARILSVDVDGRGFEAVGQDDAVVGRLQRRFPGRRPVCFGTPFEAAAWALLSQRTSGRAAAAMKGRLTDELGAVVEIDGEPLRAFPGPDRVRDVDAIPGLPAVRLARLRAVADAAVAGELDPEQLRALPAPEALAHLRRLPGVGPFSAGLILIRGAGHPDVMPLAEPRLRRAVTAAYGLDPAAVDDDVLRALGERWRPYRSWVAFLLRNALDDPIGADRRS